MSGPTPTLAVLDTNVALALWLWEDRRLAGLRTALEQGRLIWLTDAATWDEWLHELRDERCQTLGKSRDGVLGALKAGTVPIATAQPFLPQARPLAGLQCSDTSDQKFVELALQGHARWLLTRDRALLRLRKAASRLGLVIANPDGMAAQAF